MNFLGSGAIATSNVEVTTTHAVNSNVLRAKRNQIVFSDECIRKCRTTWMQVKSLFTPINVWTIATEVLFLWGQKRQHSDLQVSWKRMLTTVCIPFSLFSAPWWLIPGNSMTCTDPSQPLQADKLSYAAVPSPFTLFNFGFSSGKFLPSKWSCSSVPTSVPYTQ